MSKSGRFLETLLSLKYSVGATTMEYEKPPDSPQIIRNLSLSSPARVRALLTTKLTKRTKKL